MDIREAAKLYKERKIHWVEVAKILDDPENSEPDLEGTGLGQSSCARMVTAYRFLKYNRPEFFDNPHPRATWETVAYLPYIRQKMINRGVPDPEAEFQKLLADVLRGKVTSKDIRDVSRKLDGKEDRPVPMTGPLAIEALSKSLDVTEYLIDRALTTNPREEVGKELGEKVHRIIVKMNGIMDNDFQRMLTRGKGMDL